MDEVTYLEESKRTLSNTFVEGEVTPFLALASMCVDGNDDDFTKRRSFYGTDTVTAEKKYQANLERLDPLLTWASSQEEGAQLHFPPEVFHALLGIRSEVAEIAEALLTAEMNKTPLDLVNISEEIGDIHWYMAILHRWIGKTPSQVYDQNIAKLRVRFKEKFDLASVEHRDLFEERKILEDHQ